MIRKMLLALLISMFAMPLCLAQERPLGRIRDLREGTEMEVKGRTGIIIEKYCRPGIQVFNLRDDYGDGVIVRLRQNAPPVMGVTYLVKGTLTPNPEAKRPFLEATRMVRLYPPSSSSSPSMLMAVAGIVLCRLISVAFLFVRMNKKVADRAPAWGYLEVVQGPETEIGKSIPLHGARIGIGRSVPNTEVRTSTLDQSISRKHGEIIREGDTVYFVDKGSTHGSSINGRPVSPNTQTALLPGSCLCLGSSNMTLIFRTNKDEDWGVTLGPEQIDAVLSSKTQHITGTEA